MPIFFIYSRVQVVACQKSATGGGVYSRLVRLERLLDWQDVLAQMEAILIPKRPEVQSRSQLQSRSRLQEATWMSRLSPETATPQKRSSW
jgi:hypothetical protein